MTDGEGGLLPGRVVEQEGGRGGGVWVVEREGVGMHAGRGEEGVEGRDE